MIKLEETTIWNNLGGPYGKSEAVPGLIAKLAETNQREIADELIWEHIYHQGSIYESTLAALPHLIQIMGDSSDEKFQMDLVISLGIVLIDLDESSSLEGIFEEDGPDSETKARIQAGFVEAIKQFKTMVNSLFARVKSLNESEKRYFLIACLVTRTRHKEAAIFKTFHENTEYMFVCPHCEGESYLWNEAEVLHAYDSDPVFNKDKKKKIEIVKNDASSGLKWLEELVEDLNIESLRPLIPYFNGDLACHQCQQNSNVFVGICNSF